MQAHTRMVRANQKYKTSVWCQQRHGAESVLAAFIELPPSMIYPPILSLRKRGTEPREWLVSIVTSTFPSARFSSAKC